MGAVYVARESPLWEHVRELVVRLRRIVVAVLVSAAILSIIPVGLVDALRTFSLEPLMTEEGYVPLVIVVPKAIVSVVVPRSIMVFGRTYNVTIMPVSPSESFDVLFYTVLLLGFLGASPVVAHEVWAYIRPALYPHEVKVVKRAVVVSFILFCIGAYMGLFVAAPWFMRITLLVYPYFIPEGYPAILRVSVTEAMKLGVLTALAMGLVLQAPPVVYYLLALGVVDPSMFRGETMKLAFVASLLVGAAISPDPTGLGMLAIALTLYIPFYIAVKLGIRANRKRRMLEEKGVLLAREELAVVHKLAAEAS